MIYVNWRDILDTGPTGVLVLCLLCGANVIALLGLGVGAYKPLGVEDDPERQFSVASACAFVMGLLAAVLVVRRENQSIFATLATQEFWETWFDRMHNSEAIFYVLGWSMLAMSEIRVLSLLVRIYRSRGASRGASAAPVIPRGVGEALFGLTAIGFLLRARAFSSVHVSAVGQYSIEETIKLTSPVVEKARIGIVAAAIFFTLLIFVSWLIKRKSSPAKPVDPRVAYAILGLGALSFLATRPLAFDGSRPIPAPASPFLQCPKDAQDLAPLPADATCNTPCGERRFWLKPEATLHLSKAGVALDGVFYSSYDTLFLELSRRWSDSRKNNPTQPPLALAVAEDVPMRDLEPYLHAVARGYPKAQILIYHPQNTVETATVGNIERTPRCCCAPFREPDEPPLPYDDEALWGDVARRARKPAP